MIQHLHHRGRGKGDLLIIHSFIYLEDENRYNQYNYMHYPCVIVFTMDIRACKVGESLHDSSGLLIIHRGDSRYICKRSYIE